MKKKGFTLVELLAVLIILVALLLIIIPVVANSIKEGKEKIYNSQINNIKLALESWMSENQKPNNGEYIVLSLSQLKEAGEVEVDIKNPNTKELFPNDMILKIINNDGIIEYEVNDTGSNKSDYSLIPSMKINGNALTYVELGSQNYIDLGVTAKDKNNNSINDIDSITEPTLNLGVKGIYITKYTASSNGYSNTIYRTIIVRDTKGPEISFSNDLVLTYEAARNYDFKSDIVVTDNSREAVNVTVESNISVIPGNYSIKYIATDQSGNETVKFRKVTIKE